MENKRKIFFQHGYSKRVVLKKHDIYSFSFSEKEIAEAKKRDYENPLFINHGLCVLGLYFERRKLRVIYFHSYDVFDELMKTHKEKKHGENFIFCSCGMSFISADLKQARKKFDKHIKEIKKVFEKNGK